VGMNNNYRVRITYILTFLLLNAICVFGQNNNRIDTLKHRVKEDTINPNKGNIGKQLEEIQKSKRILHSDSINSDSAGNQPLKSSKIDTVLQNRYGDLRRDDPHYNKRYSICIPFMEGIGDNVMINLFDSKVLKYQWAMISLTSWKRNLSAGWPWGKGWDWDQTRFGNDFLSHPISGNLYYNDARCNGYNFWQSAPYALIGSYMWKLFGENITPERNSLIATTIDGIFLGEILYRLSSNILDDRTRGRERFFREALAGLIDPMRVFNRLIQGKTSQYTNKEVYQKEPLNITVYAGIHKINDHTNVILSGLTNPMLNARFDYGNPFEECSRNPFDFFKITVESNVGDGRKIIDNISGYGVLMGRNTQCENVALLEGGFLYYDYWDNNIFELSTIALGPGIFAKLPISKSINLYTEAHIGVVPFAGASTGIISDTSQSRDFNFGYGWEAKFETSLTIGKIATVGVAYYYFMIHSINSVGQDEAPYGSLGNSSIGVLEPKITLQVYKYMSIGFEYYLYSQTHTDIGYSTYNAYLTEQQVFIQFYFEDPQRRGHDE
jgi:hypothetical protein